MWTMTLKISICFFLISPMDSLIKCVLCHPSRDSEWSLQNWSGNLLRVNEKKTNSKQRDNNLKSNKTNWKIENFKIENSFDDEFVNRTGAIFSVITPCTCWGVRVRKLNKCMKRTKRVFIQIRWCDCFEVWFLAVVFCCQSIMFLWPLTRRKMLKIVKWTSEWVTCIK